MEQDNELYELAESLQKDCHEFVEKLCDEMWKTRKGKKKFDPQDAVNIFFYKKLANIELRLRKLEEGNDRAQSFIGLHTPLM